MKTIIIFNLVPEALNYLEVPEDLTQFDGIYINMYYEDHRNEMSMKLDDIIYDNDTGYYKQNVIVHDKFPTELVKSGEYVVVECGLIV